MAEPLSLDPVRHSRLLCALAEEARAYPLARKLLVCPRHGVGLELLRALAVAGQPWIGFEATTPKRVSLDLVDADGSLGAVLLDEFDEQALIDDAIDHVLQKDTASHYALLAEGVGLRRAFAQAVQALRLGGIDAGTIRRRLTDDGKREALASILKRYDELRRDRGRVDIADLFRRATAVLRDRDALPDARLLIVPGHNLRGLSGDMLQRLVELGAAVLPEDPVVGLAAPPARLGPRVRSAPATPLAFVHAVAEASQPANGLGLFAATSLESELREVMRRIVAAGASWDEAEIAATDPAAYAVALDGLARRLDIPVGYATGLPVSRTRPGRVVAAYLRWIEDDFREDVIRGLIERSEIAPRGQGVPAGPTLARRLRRLRIGSGRARYLAAIRTALRALEHSADGEDESSEAELRQYRQRERTQLLALESMLRPILEATPVLGDAIAPEQRRTSASALARGVRATLDLARAQTEVDRAAKDRMLDRLDRIEATLTRETTLRGALATLVEKLDQRVPAPEAGGRAPWLSSGGRLHFTDIDGAGRSGRRMTFVVGLDAGRFPDAAAGDALLSDADRGRLADDAAGALPTSAERIEERRYALAAALTRLRGTVTLSYAAWSAAEGRAVAPSAELLQAFRLQTASPDADYDALHGALTPHASAVPQRAQVDAADVWLGALDVNGVLRRGDAAVAAAYPSLARGLAAVDARSASTPSAYHGVLQPRRSFDPRGRDVLVSASRLQALGSCPHRYLLQYVLGVRPPRDPESNPARWLNALERGAALHEVFERTLVEARVRGVPADPRAPSATEAGELQKLAATILDSTLERWKGEQPPPGPAVFDAERRALHADVRAFARMLMDEPREWIALEQAFGEEDAPVRMQLAGGPLRIRGKIDRVDRAEDTSGLVVVDYKTGSTFPFRRETGTYAGGRRLQHAFYATGAEALHGLPVRRVEYHFPGERGRNDRVIYQRSDIQDAAHLLDRLLDMAARGWFVPTEDARADCRFCDMRDVCRVHDAGRDKLVSPLAEWSNGLWDSDVEALRALRTLREW